MPVEGGGGDGDDAVYAADYIATVDAALALAHGPGFAADNTALQAGSEAPQ